MSSPSVPGRKFATPASLFAALLWASYYGFILEIGDGASTATLLVAPFLIGGAMYWVWALFRGAGREFVQLFGSGPQWARAGMLFGAQVTILVLTLRGGAVDAALLALVGDVALTPLVVMLLYREGRGRLRSGLFVAGLVLSGAGATLTILAGGSVTGLTGVEWLAAPAVPVLVAAYFVGTARVGRSLPVSAVAGQSYVGAGLLALVAVVLYRGSIGGLVPTEPLPIVLLIGAGATSFFVAPVLYFEAIERVGIFLPSLLMGAIPVFTLGFTAILLGQIPSWLGLLGIPVAVLGGFLAVRGSQSAVSPTVLARSG